LGVSAVGRVRASCQRRQVALLVGSDALRKGLGHRACGMFVAGLQDRVAHGPILTPAPDGCSQPPLREQEASGRQALNAPGFACSTSRYEGADAVRWTW